MNNLLMDLSTGGVDRTPYLYYIECHPKHQLIVIFISKQKLIKKVKNKCK